MRLDLGKFRWLFGTEKANSIMIQLMGIALVGDLINRGENIDSIVKRGRTLGRYMGDFIFIAYHTRGNRVAYDRKELPKFINSIYTFLFGSSISKTEFIEQDNSLRLTLIFKEGIPTCRGIVSPHPKIKFGFLLVGILDKILELKKDELGIKSWTIEETKCVAVGDEYCEIEIDIEFRNGSTIRKVGLA